MIRKELEANAKKLVEEIRQYVRSQKNLWQQVPLLALDVDGRDGWSESFALAYTRLLWEVDKSYGPSYGLSVDLRTGDIVRTAPAIDGSHKEEIPSSDSDVLAFGSHLKNLDALIAIEYLKKCASRPRASYMPRLTEEDTKRFTAIRKRLQEILVKQQSGS